MPPPPIPPFEVPTIETKLFWMSGSCPNYTEYGMLTLSWTDDADGQGNGGWNATLGQLSLTLYIGPPKGYNIAATFAGQSLNTFVLSPCPVLLCFFFVVPVTLCVEPADGVSVGVYMEAPPAPPESAPVCCGCSCSGGTAGGGGGAGGGGAPPPGVGGGTAGE